MNAYEKYAKLLIETGINVQKNQTLIIKSPIETAEFARLCSIKAYEAGAREVVISWIDEKATRIKYDMAPDDLFDSVPEWLEKYYNNYAKEGAAFLSISAEDPDIMSGIDQNRISRYKKAYSTAVKYYVNRMMGNKNAWCVASMPTIPWASKVFPNLSEEEAMDKLWDAILKATRADQENPVEAWTNHQKTLDLKLDFLNSNQFAKLHYKNTLGTDVIVELPKNHIWYGGADDHKDGYKFVANMPTEEVFTLPKRDGVNGKIVSSYPLNHNGVLIEDFWFIFKDGSVVDYGAGKHKEVLDEIFALDEGARRLGEVALVPYDSPISNQKLLFYNTLFDENASCHFAFGEAYSVCIKGGEDMTPEELLAAGANTSVTHIDFMVGTEDLDITGITENGTEYPIFRKGNFDL